MVQQNTDFGRVADDLRRAATSFALLTTQASLLGRSLQAFREFERQLVVTNAIAKGTVAQYRELSNAARSFALATTSSATEAGAALQNLAQAGFSAEESLSGLGGVLLLAQATLTDVGQAADILSSNIRAFGLDTTDAIRISNLFVAAQDSSLATLDKLTFALRQVGPVSDVAGLSIEQTTAFLGELFNIGLRGEQAGTSLRNVIVRLIRPTGEAAKILQEFGIATIDATGNFRGLEAVLQDLAAANLGEAQLAKIFENEALAGAIRLLKVVSDGSENSASSYRKLLNEISGTNAALVRSLKTIDTLDGSLKLLRNSLTDAAITIGSELAPFVQDLSIFIQDLVRAFNDLDDSQKANIATWLGYSTAAVGVLATLSAFSLLIRGLALTSLPALIVGITRLGGAFAGLAASATAGSGAITAFFASFATAGGLLAVLGRLALGLTGIVLAAGVAYGAWRLFVGRSIDEINSLEAAIQNADFDIDVNVDGIDGIAEALASGRSIAQGIADAVGSDTAFAEAEARVRLADQLVNGKLIDLLAQGDIRQAIEAARTAQDVLIAGDEGLGATQRRYVELLAGQFDQDAEGILADIAQIRIAQGKLNAAAANVNSEGFFESFFRSLAGDETSTTGVLVQARKDFDSLVESLGPERAAIINSIEKRLAEFEETADSIGLAKAEADLRERDAITQLLVRLSNGNSQLAAAFDKFQFEFTAILQQNPLASQQLLDDLASEAERLSAETSPAQVASIAKAIEEGSLISVLAELVALLDGDDQDIAALIAREGVNQGNIDPEVVAEVLVAQEREKIQKVFGSLASGTAALQSDLAKSRVDALNSQAKLSDSVAEALDLVTQAGVIELERDITAIAKKVTAEYDKVFATLPDTIASGTTDAFNAAFENATGTVLDGQLAPTAASIFNGSYLTDSILSQVDQNTAPEEIAAIAEVEKARVQAIFLNYIEVLKEGGVQPENIEDLREFFATGFELINSAQIAGLLQINEARETATNRVNSRNRRGGGGSDIPKAVQNARKIEDAFKSAADAARSAERAFFEATTGISVGDGVQQLLALDVNDIIAEYDDQIRTLQRAVEDIGFDSDIGGTQQARLRDQYQETIALLEATKQAEIDAADSFEAQMERRSDAIDKYISDLRNLSVEQEGAFGQLRNGVLAAFAEFNREIVTVFDIAQEAALEFTDTISSNLADVIFEGEDLFEAFGRTILDISRKVFEGFTDILIQQTIAGITKDGGGIFESLLSGVPSLSANAGGAAGAAGAVGDAASGAGVTASITAVTTALTAGGAQITGAFAAAGAPITTGGSTAGGAIGAAGSTAGTAISTAGTSISVAGTSVATALTAAAGAITAATAAISAGGAGGGITSLFSSLAVPGTPGAFRGGQLVGNDFIRGYTNGGQVFGPGGPTTDSILALLSNKEFVVNAKATEEYLPLLDAINRGIKPEDLLSKFLDQAQGFNQGGMVGNSSFGYVGSKINTPSASVQREAVGGDTMTLNVTYNISGAGDGNTFRKSAPQHAKDLSRMLSNAKKNG